mgnify:CR=1 FL=1
MSSPKKKDQKPAANDSEQELDRLKELAARAQADLQNAKGRMEKEAQQIRSYAVEGMLLRLLPTVDNFQRAFSHLPEDLKDHDWVNGLQVMEQAFIKELGEVGLTQIESLGQQVDPELHEVLQAGPGEKDIITEVFEEGYLLHDKVLKPAKVVVGDGS